MDPARHRVVWDGSDVTLTVTEFMILEALAQLVGVLAYASEPFDSNQKLMYFMGIDKARFRTPVVPGDRMELEVEVLQRKSNIWKCTGNASVDGAVCVEAELLAAIVDRDEAY
jgi:3-hydroxyacyl-[acyl-carrier-protein] dehydratase